MRGPDLFLGGIGLMLVMIATGATVERCQVQKTFQACIQSGNPPAECKELVE